MAVFEEPAERVGGPTVTAPRSRAPIFLVGSERSGTTLLRLMLDHHPEISFEKESDFVVTMLSDEGEPPPLPAYLEWLETLGGVDFTIDRTLDYPALVEDFLCQKQTRSGGKPHVGATLHRGFHRLRFLWPDARYVHLVRDPRDVTRSVVAKGWAGNLYQACDYWRAAEADWDSLARHLTSDRFVEVRYEALITQPEAVLRDLCSFIGVDYSPAMLDYTADAPQYPPPDPTLAGRWRTALSPREVALVEARCAATMESRGYDVTTRPLPSIGRARHALLMAAGRLGRVRAAAELYGAHLVVSDVLGRLLHIRPLARHAHRRLVAVQRALIAQETEGRRSPSANLAPSAQQESS